MGAIDEYLELAEKARNAKPPPFVVKIDAGMKQIAEICERGRLLIPGADLSRDEALQLRDYITKIYEG